MKKPHRTGLIFLVLALVSAGLILAVRGTPKEREITYLRRGNDLFAQGAYEKARVEYKNAARIMPTDAEIDYRLGLVYEAEGDVNNAFAGYSLAEEQNAHFHPALLKLANYYLAGEQYDQAQKHIDAVLADSPDDPQAHALHAALLLRRKDFQGTLKEARFTLGKDPANITAISVLTGLYAAQGNQPMAIQAVEDGIARNPDSLPLLILKAQLYENSGNYPELSKSYQAIFKLKPKDSFYRVNLADIFLAAGKPDDAEAALRAAVAAEPDDWNMKRRLIVFLGDHRGVDAAEKEIRGYMRTDPKNNAPYFWLADIYVSHNAASRAVTLLEKIISEDPAGAQNLRARVSLARIYFISGHKALAEKMAAFVLQKEPDNPGALFLRANMAFDQGRDQDAVSDLRAILHVQPANKEALQLLSEVFLKQGHTDLAIDTLSQLMEIDPFNYAAEARLAQMYDLNGDSKRALQMLAEVTRAAPQYAGGWESMARIFIGIRDIPKAESAVHTLSALSGQQLTAAFLEGQIQADGGEYGKAIASYIKVVSADPSSPLAEYSLLALVKTEQRRGRLDEAAGYIETLKTGSPYVASLLGKCYATLGKTDRAAAAFDKAIAGNAMDPNPYLARATLYVGDHKTDKALEVLKKAETAIPGDVRAWMMEAQILGDSGRYQEAIRVYEGLLARNPGFDIAANNLASIITDYEYTDPVMLEKAHQLAERFTGASNPLLLDTLGWVYYRQGDLNRALSLTMQAMELGGRIPPQVHYHYGITLLKAGKPREARAELQQAVADETLYPGLKEAKELLKGL
jgi:putative PEP-CTERM system TPR-repeat lipoprotein